MRNDTILNKYHPLPATGEAGGQESPLPRTTEHHERTMSFESHSVADNVSGDSMCESATFIFGTVGRPRAEQSVTSQQFLSSFDKSAYNAI